MKTYLRHYEIKAGDVLAAYLAWAGGESGRKNSYRVYDEYGSASALIMEIYREIRSRSLHFRPIHRYKRIEPTNGKTRIIGVESVKQQVCDYLAVTLLEPMYHARVGFYQVASVKGKGQNLCRKALRRWVGQTKYHVKMDFKQCYPSTTHHVVMRAYRKLVGSADVLYVISALLATYTGGGLEIGSYFSLRTMQLMLSYGYHHVEGLYKSKRGKSTRLVRHQIWHMDDVLLLGTDKRNLKMAARSLERYMLREFGLTIKPWKIAKTGETECLDLGGWVTRRRSSTARSGTFLRATRSFHRFTCCPSPRRARKCASYWGWFKYGDMDRVRDERGIGATFAHARSVVSRADRLGITHDTNPIGDAAGTRARETEKRVHGRLAASQHRA